MSNFERFANLVSERVRPPKLGLNRIPMIFTSYFFSGHYVTKLGHTVQNN